MYIAFRSEARVIQKFINFYFFIQKYIKKWISVQAIFLNLNGLVCLIQQIKNNKAFVNVLFHHKINKNKTFKIKEIS